MFTGAVAGRVIGIEMNVSSALASVSEIQGNTIAGIQLTSASTANLRIFSGISILNISRVNIGTTTGNIIGSNSGTNSITVSSTLNIPEIDGIFVSSSSSSDIRNNTIGAINTASGVGVGHTFNGIYVQSNGPHTISNNTIGNATSNSISIGVAGSTAGLNIFRGIYSTSNPGALTVSGNVVQNAIAYNTNAATEVVGIYCFNGNGTISGNNVHDLTANSSAGASLLYGIWHNANTTGGAITISNNTVHDLTTNATTGVSATTGLNIQGGNITTDNVGVNKIYNLTSSSTGGGIVSGISVWGGTTHNIYNNIIGNLTAPAANLAAPSVFGIRFGNANPTNLNVYYNTIYLNAISTGATFSTAGIYHTFHATTGLLTMRNNIIINRSTYNGAGRTVAFHRSLNTNLNNYVNTSNNNLFYAGNPAGNNFIFFDNVTGYNTLAAFQAAAGVAPRESASVTESTTPFLNTVNGSLANYLHIDNSCTGTATVAESGAVNIATYTTDYDTEIRQGNPGYTGGGSAPDIGADEFDVSAIEVTATAGVLGPTNYSTLKGAFDKINDGTHQGDITIRVLCSTE